MDNMDNVVNEIAKTDKQRTKEFLESLGIGFAEDLNKVNTIRITVPSVCDSTEEDGGVVQGYCDFFTQFEFDSNGKFVLVGIWE